MLKELSTSSQFTSSGEIKLSVLRRTCQVTWSTQFLLNKSKDMGLKLNNGTGEKQERGGQDTSYLETTGALFANGYQTRGRKKRKEH